MLEGKRKEHLPGLRLSAEPKGWRGQENAEEDQQRCEPPEQFIGIA
jgi:hypothetical protein